jgi:hypothetical protein
MVMDACVRSRILQKFYESITAIDCVDVFCGIRKQRARNGRSQVWKPGARIRKKMSGFVRTAVAPKQQQDEIARR